MKFNSFKILALIAAISLMVGACSTPASAPTAVPTPIANTPVASPATVAAPTAASGGDKVALRYALWDSNQQPAYQACLDAFSKQNPNIMVSLEQAGWGQYWDGLTTGFVAGNAPDVFTDHLSKYPEFLSKGQLLDIEPYVKQDKVDLGIYLVDPSLWVKDGKRYGLPKDWDTIAVFYNQDMLTAAGVTADDIKNWTWNPTDGGTFEKIMAKLTLDKNGKNGLDSAFDKNNVVQYGYAGGAGDPGTGGQTEWSSFAASAGFKLTDGPWATAFHYDDPNVAATLQWWSDIAVVKKYAADSNALSGTDVGGLFQAKKVAMITNGSWRIGDLVGGSTFKVGLAKLPAGPKGVKSPINGLSDAIWSGTKHPAEAWKLVKFLASPDCANIVGGFGVVFPAIQSGVDNAVAKHKANGRDVTAFTDEAAAKDGTYLLPMTDHGSEIAALVNPVLTDIFDGKAKAATALPDLNKQIDALFK
jgi:multiple sugar transport system substrate-binding protein